jgi:hypothetical protein
MWITFEYAITERERCSLRRGLTPPVQQAAVE